MAKNLLANAEDAGLIPGWEISPKEGRTTHSSILAWGIPWTEESGRLQSMGHKESEMTETTEFAYIYMYKHAWAFLIAQSVENLPAM